MVNVAPDETLHQRILNELQGNIVSGDWSPGFRIPFETDLAETYGCSRMTVNKVLTELARSGLIERRRKSGSFVRQPQAQSAVLEISDLKSEVESLGLAYRYQLISSHKHKAKADEKQHLGLSKPAPVLSLKSLHYAGKNPFCFEQRVINLDAVPEAANADFIIHAPGPWLISRVPWSAAEHVIRAMEADETMADALNTRIGTACLVVERRTLWQEAYLTWVRLSYVGDSHALTARFTPNPSAPTN